MRSGGGRPYRWLLALVFGVALYLKVSDFYLGGRPAPWPLNREPVLLLVLALEAAAVVFLLHPRSAVGLWLSLALVVGGVLSTAASVVLGSEPQCGCFGGLRFSLTEHVALLVSVATISILGLTQVRRGRLAGR